MIHVLNSDAPVLYSDADGVCLDWLTPFIRFCESKGYRALHDQPKHFNMVDIFPTLASPWTLIPDYHQSEFYAQIVAYEDAKHAFRKIKEAGVDIVIVTSSGKEDHVVRCRQQTIEKEFGGIVSDIRFLDYRSPKFVELKKHRPGIFIDDQIQMVKEGQKAGHHSLLRDRSYNRELAEKDIRRIEDMQLLSLGISEIVSHYRKAAQCDWQCSGITL